MKELTVQHLPAENGQPTRVRVGYRANERAQSQWREAEFNFALTTDDRRGLQWYLEQYLQCPWGAFRERAAGVEATMERLGAELFRAVFGSEATRGQYSHVADHLPDTRIVIHAADPEGVALPWELLRDPQKPYGDLARQAAAFVRGQPDLTEELPAPPSGPTFNILLVISRPDKEDGTPDDVPFQSVARPLLELCRPYRDRVHIDVLRPPTFEQLQKVLGDRPSFYHVLHFDGHGAFPAGAAAPGVSQGVLAFEGENVPRRLVTGAELGGILAGKGVPLVVLNACQSGMTQTEAIYASVGNQLLQAGVGGVVAMAYAVYVQSAVRFVARFYERLMAGDDAARAVHVGREALRAHPGRPSPIGELPLRDWMVPIFFEAAAQPLLGAPLTGVRLLPTQQHAQQAQAGAEIGCPDPPAFGFVGRDDALLRLERAFLKETVVLLEGMAGVGKTETAAYFARWRAETGALDGPIFWFKFEHYLTLERVVNEVGRAFNDIVRRDLKQDWETIDDLAFRCDIALQILQQARCLLIWDNFEPAHGFPTGTPSDWTEEEQRALRDFLHDLRGGATKVLLTSRRDEAWLGPIYKKVELGGLELSEQQELAVKVLERAGVSHHSLRQLPDYNDLLHYLRGNPLAIQAILPELQRRQPQDLLAALQSGEAQFPDDLTQGRERSLTASLNYRFNQLDPLLRQHLSVLGMFQGFVDTGLLASMCSQHDVPLFLKNISADEWEVALNAAAELGLVRQTIRGYYEIHPALPWFFMRLFDQHYASNSAQLETAFIGLFGGVGVLGYNQMESNTPQAIFILATQEPNLRRALELARRYERWDNAIGIVAGLTAFLNHTGSWVESNRILQQFEWDLATEQGEPLPGLENHWLHMLHFQLGLWMRLHDFQRARRIGYKIKEFAERRANDETLSIILGNLQSIETESRNFQEAESLSRQKVQVDERLSKSQSVADLINSARPLMQIEKFDEAEAILQTALHRAKSESQQHATPNIAMILHNLGIIAQGKREFEKARRFYIEAASFFKSVGNSEGVANAFLQVGIIESEGLSNFPQAEKLFSRALRIYEDTNNKNGIASVCVCLGAVAIQQNRLSEAHQWMQRASDLLEKLGDDHGLGLAYQSLGVIYEKQGDAGNAAKYWDTALQLFEKTNDDSRAALMRAWLDKLQSQ